MIDLIRLPPAPWKNGGADKFVESEPWTHTLEDGNGDFIGQFDCDFPDNESHKANDARCNRAKTILDFVVMFRNDLDVKQRRGWHTEQCTAATDQWCVPQLFEHLCGKTKEEGDKLIEAMYQKYHDVGLLTKADRWYRENVEKPC